MYKFLTVLVCVLALVSAGASSQASSVTTPYGNATGSNVAFKNMQETDTPGGAAVLYDAPTPTANSLAFNSTSFQAAGGTQFTGYPSVEGVFSTTIEGLGGASINQLSFDAGGQYSLFGSLNATDTTAHVRSTISVDVMGIDGHSLGTPIILTPKSMSIYDTAANIPSTGDFSIPQGQTDAFYVPWNGAATINLGDYGLSGAVTSLKLSVDTKLWTNTPGTTGATIYQVPSDIHVAVVPTPRAVWAGLAMLGVLGVWEVRRRRAAA